MSTSLPLDEFLNVFWLRPETALWRALDCQAMQAFRVQAPSLDIGCGDGIFSFVRAGGRFGSEFDAFQSLSDLEQYFENADVFDHFNASLSPTVAKLPDYQFSVGFDHKHNLLKKAGQLGLYQSLQQGDANKALPFEDNTFNSIFSNIVYWLDEPQAVLKEIGRILRAGGRACLMLPNRTLPEFSFYNQLFVKTQDEKWRFLEKLDRGRFADNIRQARSQNDWETMFANADLRVVEHKRHLSKPIIQAWDIGFRPIFPSLCRMATHIPKDELTQLKQEWIASLKQFLEPLFGLDGTLAGDNEPAFHCYILEKQSV